MKIFEFSLEELNKLLEKHPKNENIRAGEDHVHCNACNWEFSKLFVIAETRDEAVELLLSGDAGLCGECIAQILVEGNYIFGLPVSL